MRIAYLNPFVNAAESQAYFSLAAAGRSLGVELVSCNTPEDVDASAADFVLSVSSSVPKIADMPSYLTVHEPTKRFRDRAVYMNNLLSYDGYLTISDTLERFVKDICFGTGRYGGVGFYYNSPQISTLRTDLSRTVADGNLRIVYIGTNWDRRAPALLERLDRWGILRIHGPEASWSSGSYTGYAGALPFDGEAPQQAYAQAGMGLVLLSDDHLSEDIISNRIFEISSVGAVAVCPAIPWIRKWFGDTVLYYDPSASHRAIADEVRRHRDEVARDPGWAEECAARARAVFERTFAAERMLENAVAYHEEVQQARSGRLVRLAPEPHVSVVVRCGSRRGDLLRNAIATIRRQTFGSFTVILSKYEDVDLSDITADLSGRIERFVELLTPGGTRAETLVAGLSEVKTDYFAILDDDDFWLSDHIESLFAAARAVDPNFDAAFSGSVAIGAEGTEIEKDLWWHRNIYTFGLTRPPETILDVTSGFSSNCFVARTPLLPPELDALAMLETAEDSLVVALVTRNKPPVFSYKPTAFFRRGFAGESNFATVATRERDLQSLELRAGLLLRPTWLVARPVAYHTVGRRRSLLVRVFQYTMIYGPRATIRRVATEVRSRLRARRREGREAARRFRHVIRYLVSDLVVLGRIMIARTTGRDHPSARRELLVSPQRALELTRPRSAPEPDELQLVE